MASLAERLYFGSPTPVQNALVTVMGYQLYTKRYTGIYHELRQLVLESREWSIEKREAYQNEQLFMMTKHCRKNIPYYRKLFAEYGLHENDITGLSDLRKLPVLTKTTLRSNISEFQQKDKKPFIIQHTSGSTGTPLALYENERTYKLAMALLVDHEEYHGVPFGARRATFAGRMIQRQDNMNPPFSRFNKAENQRLYSSYHLNENTFNAYRKDLDKFCPIEIIGYPSAISDLANFYRKFKIQAKFHPKVIITNSETLLVWQRDLIENVFGCPVYDYYGTAEYVIFAGQKTDGLYYPNPLLGITEILPETPGSSLGKVIGTTLTNYAMPLLRYDVGDTATLANENGDTIGTPVIRTFNGRTDDYIETKDGRRIGRIDHIFKGVNGVREAQVVQHKSGSAVVKLVNDGSGKIDEFHLIENCKHRLGRDFSISIEYLDHIPRGKNGKFRSVLRLNNE